MAITSIYIIILHSKDSMKQIGTTTHLIMTTHFLKGGLLRLVEIHYCIIPLQIPRILLFLSMNLT